MAYESILVGSGKVYVADVATAFPAVNAAPGVGWTDLGEFDGGVTATLEQTTVEHRIDSETGPVKATRSEEGLAISTNLAEATLENLAKVLDDKTVTPAAGPPATKSMGMYRGGVVREYALLFRGNSPYAAGVYAQFQVPRAYVASDSIGMSFVKDGKTLIPVEFRALVDPLAGTDAAKFGTLVAQTA